jgi:hypothetical protein
MKDGIIAVAALTTTMVGEISYIAFRLGFNRKMSVVGIHATKNAVAWSLRLPRRGRRSLIVVTMIPDRAGAKGADSSRGMAKTSILLPEMRGMINASAPHAMA